MLTRLPLPAEVPATTALSRLEGAPGVHRAAALSDRLLVLDYDPARTTRGEIAATLGIEAPTRGLRARWQALAEATRRDAPPDYPLGFRQRVREAYLHRYRHRRHGRRDDRPQHWRRYLKAEATTEPSPDPPIQDR